jgi:hypothetical protein
VCAELVEGVRAGMGGGMGEGWAEDREPIYIASLRLGVRFAPFKIMRPSSASQLLLSFICSCINKK